MRFYFISRMAFKHKSAIRRAFPSILNHRKPFLKMLWLGKEGSCCNMCTSCVRELDKWSACWVVRQCVRNGHTYVCVIVGKRKAPFRIYKGIIKTRLPRLGYAEVGSVSPTSFLPWKAGSEEYAKVSSPDFQNLWPLFDTFYNQSDAKSQVRLWLFCLLLEEKNHHYWDYIWFWPSYFF